MTDPLESPTLRDVAPGDIEAIHALNNAAEPFVNAVSVEQMQWFVERAVSFRVATDGRRLAGFLVALPPDLDYKSLNYRWFNARYDEFVYVDRIVVADSARGRGLGNRFYDDLIAFTRGRAPRIIAEVNTRPRNDVSLRFHEKFGFRIVGRQETEGGRKEVALMELAVVRDD